MAIAKLSLQPSIICNILSLYLIKGEQVGIIKCISIKLIHVFTRKLLIFHTHKIIYGVIIGKAFLFWVFIEGFRLLYPVRDTAVQVQLGLPNKMGSSFVIAKIISYYFLNTSIAVGMQNLKNYWTDEADTFCINGLSRGRGS